MFDSSVFLDNVEFWGNKNVALLAKLASSSCYIGPEPSDGVSVSTIYSSISSWAAHEQNKHKPVAKRQAKISNMVQTFA